MKWRGAITVALMVTALLLTTGTAATAEYRGSDIFSNVSGGTELSGSAMDRIPLGNLGLDWHIDTTGTLGLPEAEGGSAAISAWLTNLIVKSLFFTLKLAIGLFVLAFNFDLINGQGNVLKPIAAATVDLYENTIRPFLLLALAVTGGWAVHKGLGQRRISEVFTGVGVSFLIFIGVLFLIYQPRQVIGPVTGAVDATGLALLGSVADGDGRPQVQVADQFFNAYVMRPWAVLNFGGLQTCTDGTDRDKDGFPRPVKPSSPKATTCRDVLTAKDGYGGYGTRYLKYAPGTDERKAQYEALRDGEAGDGPEFNGVRIDKADAPAVDIQQEAGAGDRLVIALVMVVSLIPVALLFGLLSLAIILAKVLFVGILLGAAVMAVFALIPGYGHQVVKSWLSKLGICVAVIIPYCFVLVALVILNGALFGPLSGIGPLPAVMILGALHAGIIVKRKWLVAQLPGVRGRDVTKVENRTDRVRQVAVGAAVAPFATMASMARRDRTDDDGLRQQSALGDSDRQDRAPADTRQPDSAPELVAAPVQPVEPQPDRSSVPVPPQRQEPAMPTESFGDALATGRQEQRKPDPAPASVPAEAEVPPLVPDSHHRSVRMMVGADTYAADLKEHRQETARNGNGGNGDHDR